jgi:hypothetical protein
MYMDAAVVPDRAVSLSLGKGDYVKDAADRSATKFLCNNSYLNRADGLFYLSCHGIRLISEQEEQLRDEIAIFRLRRAKELKIRHSK